MRISIKNALAAICAAAPTVVSSQPSTCASVYADATRNIEVYTRTLSEQNSIFSNHCEANGSLKQSSKYRQRNELASTNQHQQPGCRIQNQCREQY